MKIFIFVGIFLLLVNFCAFSQFIEDLISTNAVSVVEESNAERVEETIVVIPNTGTLDPVPSDLEDRRKAFFREIYDSIPKVNPQVTGIRTYSWYQRTTNRFESIKERLGEIFGRFRLFSRTQTSDQSVMPVAEIEIESEEDIDEAKAEEIILGMMNYRMFYNRFELFKDFQYANNLEPDGIFGRNTRRHVYWHYCKIKEAERIFPEPSITLSSFPVEETINRYSSELEPFFPGLITRNGGEITAGQVALNLIMQESSFYHKRDGNYTVSKYRDYNVGAIGFTQVMPYHGYNRNLNPYNPDEVIRLGMIILGDCVKMAQGTKNPSLRTENDDSFDLLSKALAGYNGGPYRMNLRNMPWTQIVEEDAIPKESIHYGIIIKARMDLPLKQCEINWMNANGYSGQLTENNY